MLVDHSQPFELTYIGAHRTFAYTCQFDKLIESKRLGGEVYGPENRPHGFGKSPEEADAAHALDEVLSGLRKGIVHKEILNILNI